MAEYDELKREVEELWQRVFRLNEDLPGEEWRDIVGYEGLYQVSNLGRVKSFHNGRNIIRAVSIDSNGYCYLPLSKNGVIVYVKFHRFVAEAFIPNPENKFLIYHKDNNKKNNHVENLQWVTQSENERFAYIDDVKLPFSPCRKLLPEDIRYIRENPDGLTGVTIAKKFSVSC